MRYLVLGIVFLAGCATVAPVSKQVSQGSKAAGVAGTGNVTVTKMIDGRQNVQIDLIGQPLGGK